MNEYDSQKMADILRASHGFELTTSPEDADLLLVNTCSIREKAQEKVFSELGRWRALKEKRPGLMIGVGVSINGLAKLAEAVKTNAIVSKKVQNLVM